MPSQQVNINPRFTVFVRLPFSRGEFVDPPSPEWDTSKDRLLWEVLSQPSKGNDIDWKAMYELPDTTRRGTIYLIHSTLRAERFGVTLPFLLQQAAWLYDRQLSQVRAQINKVGSQNPIQGISSLARDTPCNQSIPRAGSDSSVLPSRLPLQQRDSHTMVNDSSSPSTSMRSKGLARRSGGTPQPQSPREMSILHQRPSRRSSTETTRPAGQRESRMSVLPPLFSRPDEESSEPLSSVNSESNSDDSDSHKGTTFKRFGKFSMLYKPTSSSNEEDDEDSPAFLPIAAQQETAEEYENNSQQLISQPQSHSQRTPRVAQGVLMNRRQTAPGCSNASSINSGINTSLRMTDPQQSQCVNRHIGSLSPRRAAELSGSNTRGGLNRREASDGTPSMGSSFSDLDDASVTQSALEEALLSKIQHGGVTSRMSTLSQALRSKYL